jgi:NADH dehydrogenase
MLQARRMYAMSAIARACECALGEFSTVGNMMGGLIGGSLMIEGTFARLMYMSLYKMHELALHGFVKVSLDTLARLITRRTEPHVKLH